MKRGSNIGKRLTALCLTLLLAVGMMATAAFAAPVVENTGSIAVSGVEKDVTVSAYKVLDVNFDYTDQQPVDPEYVWNNAVKNWVSTNYSSYIGTDDSVTEAFTKATAAQVAEFYDRLAAVIKDGTINLTAAGSCTAGDGGIGAISNLPMGGYLLLVENGMKVYRPSAVNIVPEYDETTKEWKMSTSALTVKASEPTIEKTVNEENTNDGHNASTSDKGAIGDPVSFDLRADVPQYPANAIAKQYAISDTLSKGLTLTDGSIKVYGVEGTTETPLSENIAYTVSKVRPNNQGATSFTLTFAYEQIADYEKIHVEYSAVINKDAVAGQNGNPNKAILDYNNNPYDNTSWKEKPDEVKVYTYGLKVTKVNNKNEELTGAEFTLSKSAEGKDPISFIKTGDGVYRVAETADEQGATTVLEVGASDPAKGKLTISGLSTGTYYLTETKAPGGYNKPNSPVTIEIKDDNADGKPTIGNEAKEYDDGYVALDVVNTQGFQLPVTGGMGTVVFTAGGIVIMGAAVLLFFVLRRRKTASER